MPKIYRGFNDTKPPSKEYFDKIKRITKNQIIWGVNYFSKDNSFSAGRIVWDKDNSGNFNDCELAYQSFTQSIKLFRYRWNGMLQENMKEKEDRIHPTQKPVQLYKWLLKNYAKPGDRIFDSHGGSCSSVIAAYDGGFDMVCCELDPDYFESAVARVLNHAKQLDMFNPAQEIKIFR